MITLAFDVYGTLINTHGIVVQLQQMIGDKAPAFSQTWRDKQLEYSFRRGLMQQYQQFSVCTAQALDYTCDYYSTALSDSQKDLLLQAYSALPVFDDVTRALTDLQALNIPLYAFSNGSRDAVETLLQNAGIIDNFTGVVSVDDIQTFKPNPATYAHFVKQAQSEPQKTWLISSNSFDVLGARSFGLKAAWLQRTPASQLDPWEFTPTAVIQSLSDLKAILVK